MMDLIEPSHFDAVVVTSGLPEVLIASALARAGQSVLVLDAADSYGGSWASLSGPDFVHQLINQQLELQQQQQQQQVVASEQQTPPAAASAEADPAGSGAASVTLRPAAPLAGASGVALHTHPRLQEALSSRGLIVDLAPKVLYQDEALVQLLVSCQAHNYLEFKLVEGSYIFQGGGLSRVAASRADLFADKSLSLADKRALGRFLTGCLEAQQGLGRLKDAFNQQPLVELLQAEGLSQQLQDTVLYGIAMADTPQQQQQQQQQDGTGNPASANNSSSSGLLTAADALAALQLYSSSLGRYGGNGAFMAPCYGCGSLPEAFVRLAAVQGAVTALRHAATQLLLPPAAGQPKAAEAAEAGTDGSGAGSQAGAASAEPAADSAAPEPAVRAQVVLASGQRLTADVVVCCQDSRGSSSSSSDAETPGPAAASTVAVARAVAVMEGSVVDDEGSLLLVFPPGSLGATQAAVVRGLQLGPSLAVAPPSKFLLYLSALLPPGMLDSCSSCSGAADDSSAVAEQVLRPALSAIASMEGLSAMRLSSSSSSDDEEDDPRAEKAAPSSSGGDTATAAPAADKPSAAAIASAAAPAAAAAAASPAAEEAAASAHESAAAAAARSRPQVLAAAFFTTHQPAAQQQQHSPPAAAGPQQDDQQQQPGAAPASTAASVPGDAVLWCPGAPPGLISYQQPVQDAEAAFRQHFPQLPWLSDPVRPRQPAGVPVAAAAAASGAGGEDCQGQDAAGDGHSSSSTAADAGAGQANGAQRGDAQGGGGGGVLDDDELDAIDELTAALAQLAAPLDAAVATGAAVATDGA